MYFATFFNGPEEEGKSLGSHPEPPILLTSLGFHSEPPLLTGVTT